MSNEVNQAYLRAYIKNRVANSREREASAPLPSRQVPTSQGGLENLYRRADAAREQIPAPRATYPATENEPAQRPVSRPAAVRNVLGTKPVGPAPATPSFASIPSASPKPFATMPSVAPREAIPGTPRIVPAVRQPAVRHTQAPASNAPAVPHTSDVPQQPAVEKHAAAAVPSVWSPLGAERGMKAAGVFRQQPAVVVNGTPYTVGANDANRADANRAAPVAPAPVAPKAMPVDVPAESHRVAHPDGQSNLRIDPAHVPANHYGQDPIQRVSEPVSHQPVSHQPARERSPEHFARDMARREIEEKLVREERRAAPPASKVQAFVSHAAEELPAVEESPVAAFGPSWEVDRFFWPEVLYQLESSDKQAFELIGRHLISANQDGLKVMAVTSGERGVGRSTVAMHLARAAAAAGLRVALLDADTSCPSLIDQLRLDMDYGWQDSLFENVPLEEVAVRSMDDNLTVFPLTSVIAPQQLHANLGRVAKFIQQIADAHDIVFLDSHRLNLEQRDLVGFSKENFIDAAVVVVDTELSIKEKVDTAICILQGMGIASIGLVENFHA